ncbi:hypothetical protein BDQ17DRAFT_1324180 [Cyathus striatus]|nr:hypothetical protein BDQ17DRAFT_1324180 [Cyathus striatus]
MTSIPHFCNPHFQRQAAKPVSRKELCANEQDSEYKNNSHDVDCTVEALNDAIKRSLAWDEDDRLQRKRRRVKESAGLDANNEDFYIHLHLLQFEPVYEDNKVQAKLRRKQAKATAVDVPWIFCESQKPVTTWPSGHNNELFASGNFSSSAPALLLLESLQLPRCSRPPVPATDLKCYPYIKTIKLRTMEMTRLPACPTMEIKFGTASEKRKRKRRGKRQGV